MRSIYFISHPDVVISPLVPITHWPLSERGRARMAAALSQPWVPGISAVYCSTEQKAIDGAQILAEHRGLAPTQVAALGENDRSSTGYLPLAEFETVADAFFAQPGQSVRGWETAAHAQARIVAAVASIAEADTSAGALGIVSHGAVGTLLYCHLTGQPISRRWDQPANGGGNYFTVQWGPQPQALSWWLPIDGVAPAP
ncbi:histidine phosphatase family protein [Acidovorax sp.]|uniref:histidine phosphatase family protein n=1 Tax=Acidovorax sp. TaxID=1872122 RepID=UPI003CFEE210